jgi:parallel beta-helix repeat protein
MKKSIAARKSTRPTFRPSLESLEKRLTPSAYTVSSLADSGPGSLRAAITSVNGDSTADVIDFSVAGVIRLTSGALPTITNTVKVDGTSAPGFDNSPVVEIDNNGFAGLTINAPNSTLASLSVVNADGPGVTLLGSGGLELGGGGSEVTVIGNYIGLALDGSVAANTGVGLFLDSSTGDTIGGTTPLDRNVISGNGAGGIEVGPSGPFGLTGNILGNFIGTDPTGQAAAANQGNGITIFAGVGDRGNLSGAFTVGGTDHGAGNTIAFNSQYGIVVDTGHGNTISENSIFNNGAGGISLTNGGNNNQPAPVLTAAFQPTPTTNEISGTHVVPHTTPPSALGSYVVEFFATPTGTPAGQGQNFIGSLTVVPNEAGIATFVFRSSFASSSGTSFTATATNVEGATSTSAFSPAVALGGNANTVFVASAYGLLLDRAPDAAAAFWVNGLNGGTLTPVSAVLGIEGSEEYIRDQVDAMYSRYLDRAADPQGEQHWVALVQAGGTFEQVAEGLANSQEYYVLKGGTDQGFITGLYADVLNRSASTAELAGWETALASGASRASVAVGFLTSQEYRTDLVQSDYTTFLHRAADPGGLAHWVNALNAAFTDQELLAAILGSPEGYQLWS